MNKDVDQKAVQQRKLDLDKEYSKFKEEVILEEKPEESADRKKQLKRFKQQAASSQLTQDRPGMGTEFNQFNDPFFKEELTDEEIESMIDELSEEELLGLDEHDEWDLVYEDTEEVIPVHPEEEKIDLMEVLSRQERIKGKIRLRRTQAKRNRTTKINVRRFAPPAVINKRARRLAIKLIKKRMLRGRDPSSLSTGEKERIERVIEKRKKVLGRLAMRLAPRVRQIEKARLSHKKFTKAAPNVSV